jgi:hypothetical protein
MSWRSGTTSTRMGGRTSIKAVLPAVWEAGTATNRARGHRRPPSPLLPREIGIEKPGGPRPCFHIPL